MKLIIKDKEFYIDGILKNNLDLIKKNIKKDWDYLFIIDGEVGSGKSVFAQLLAWYCSDGDFSLDQICFDPKQFKQAVLKAKKYQAIIFDEAFRGLSARAAMTQTNRIIVSMLQEIRQKNLFVFVVLPSIWDVDRYVSLHRCKGLFHVHTDERKYRGFFKFYKREKIMWLLGNSHKMRYKYPAAPQFKGRFTHFYPLGEEEYKKKKSESLGDYGYEENKENKESLSAKYWKENFLVIKDWLSLNKGKEIKTLREIFESIGLNYGNLCHSKSRTRAEGITNFKNETKKS